MCKSVCVCVCVCIYIYIYIYVCVCVYERENKFYVQNLKAITDRKTYICNMKYSHNKYASCVFYNLVGNV